MSYVCRCKTDCIKGNYIADGDFALFLLEVLVNIVKECFPMLTIPNNN